MIKRALNVVRRDGFFTALKNFYFVIRTRNSVHHVIRKRKIDLSREVYDHLEGVVHYGLFKGLRLGTTSWWGIADISGMLLGIYEKEILDSLASIPSSHKVLVELGAADGYYAIGAIVSKLFDSSYCYESSELGRMNIEANALLNNVNDRVAIQGKADPAFYEYLQLANVDMSKCVLLCDIEGGEFELFDADMFDRFKGSVIIIEIHDWFFEDGKSRYQQLKRNASCNFNITELTTGPRDLSVFPELNAYCDEDRWLMASEGRGRLMTWVRLDPK